MAKVDLWPKFGSKLDPSMVGEPKFSIEKNRLKVIVSKSSLITTTGGPQIAVLMVKSKAILQLELDSNDS